MAKYNTPYKYVLEGIQDAIDMGYLSEDRKTWWLQCSWHINGEDIICFFEVLQMLKIDVFRRMGARPVVIEYTEGEEENNVEEIGFDGGYKISSEKFPPIYIGWYVGPGALAKELVPVTRLATKDSAMPFIESKKRTGRIKESTSWEKKFEQKIKQRVVRIFQDWVDEDNAQGMVDDFDIHPDNAVEELINEILENEADEIHEGRYEDFLYTIMDEEDINQKEIEKVGEAYLDKLEGLNIEEKRKTFGKSYCNKLEKQMQYVSAFGDDEDEDYTEKPSDYEKY